MTAKFLNNYPAKNAVRIISQNRKFVIILSILSLLGIPMMMFTGLLEGYLETLDDVRNTYTNYFNCGPYVAIGGFCAGIAVFLGMFCGVRAYEEEWNKTRVDMLYALPLNGTQRFFSNYAGGFVMYIVPYIVSILLGWIMLLIMIPMILSLDNSLAEDVNQIYLYYFLGSLGLGVLMWMYYTISAITAGCCGTMFENIYTNLLLNLLIPGTFALVLGAVTEHVSGLDFEYSWDAIGYMSPIGGAIYIAYLISEKGLDADWGYSYSDSYHGYGGLPETSGFIPTYLRWIFTIIILTAGLTVLAWKIYQHRKAEQVGTPFVYKWIYYIILTAVTVCILCVAAFEDDFFIAAIIFSAIVYFIMEVVRKRGFKKFWLSAVTYVVTVVVAIGGYALAVMTDCFGRVNYIPPVGTIASVEITFDNQVSSSSSQYTLNYRDREMISKLRDLHKDYLDNHESLKEQLTELSEEYHYSLIYDYNYNNAMINSSYSYDDYLDKAYSHVDGSRYFSGGYFTLTYHTIAGTSIHRSYDLYPDEYLNLMEICSGTEAYAEANGRLLKNRLMNEVRTYNNTTHEYEIPANTSFEINSSPVSRVSTTQKIFVNNTETSIQQLADSYQQDLQNLSFEHWGKDRIFGYIQNMPIYESCSNTLNLLKEWGFKEFSLNEILSFEMQGSSADSSLLEVQIYAPENYCTGSLHYPSWLAHPDATALFKKQTAYEDVFTILYQSEMQKYYPEFTEILQYARPSYTSKERCYLLVINGAKYLIPEANSDAVEKLISKGSSYYLNKIWNEPSTTSRNAVNF